jgi:hypothetical protein
MTTVMINTGIIKTHTALMDFVGFFLYLVILFVLYLQMHEIPNAYLFVIVHVTLAKAGLFFYAGVV